jgi:hypothetical protein
VTILACGGDCLLHFLRRTFPGHGVDAFLVVSCIVTRLALNLLDDLRVWNLIRIEPFVALNASQRPMDRPFELCSIDKE